MLFRETIYLVAAMNLIHLVDSHCVFREQRLNESSNAKNISYLVFDKLQCQGDPCKLQNLVIGTNQSCGDISNNIELHNNRFTTQNNGDLLLEIIGKDCLLQGNHFINIKTFKLNIQCTSINIIQNIFSGIQQANISISAEGPFTITNSTIERTTILIIQLNVHNLMIVSCLFESLTIVKLNHSYPTTSIQTSCFSTFKIEQIITNKTKSIAQGNSLFIKSCTYQKGMLANTALFSVNSNSELFVEIKDCYFINNTLDQSCVVNLKGVDLKMQKIRILGNKFTESNILYAKSEVIKYNVQYLQVSQNLFQSSFIINYSGQIMSDDYILVVTSAKVTDIQVNNNTFSQLELLETQFSESIDPLEKFQYGLVSVFSFASQCLSIITRINIYDNQVKLMPLFSFVYAYKGAIELGNFRFYKNTFMVIEFKLFYLEKPYSLMIEHITWENSNQQLNQQIHEEFNYLFSMLYSSINAYYIILRKNIANKSTQEQDQGLDDILYQACLVHQTAFNQFYPVKFLYMKEGYQLKMRNIYIYPSLNITLQLFEGVFQSTIIGLQISNVTIFRNNSWDDLSIIKVRGNFHNILIEGCIFDGLWFKGLSPISIDARDQNLQPVNYVINISNVSISNIRLTPLATPFSIISIEVAFPQFIYIADVNFRNISILNLELHYQNDTCKPYDTTTQPEIFQQASQATSGQDVALYPLVQVYSSNAYVRIRNMIQENISVSNSKQLNYFYVSNLAMKDCVFREIRQNSSLGQSQVWGVLEFQGESLEISHTMFHRMDIVSKELSAMILVAANQTAFRKILIAHITLIYDQGDSTQSSLIQFARIVELSVQQFVCNGITLQKASIITINDPLQVKVRQKIYFSKVFISKVIKTGNQVEGLINLRVTQHSTSIIMCLENSVIWNIKLQNQTSVMCAEINSNSESIRMRYGRVNFFANKQINSLLYVRQKSLGLQLLINHMQTLHGEVNTILDLQTYGKIILNNSSFQWIIAQNCLFNIFQGYGILSNLIVHKITTISLIKLMNCTIFIESMIVHKFNTYFNQETEIGGSIISGLNSEIKIMLMIAVQVNGDYFGISCVNAKDSSLIIMRVYCINLQFDHQNGVINIYNSNVTADHLVIRNCKLLNDEQYVGGGLFYYNEDSPYNKLSLKNFSSQSNTAMFGRQMVYFSQQPFSSEWQSIWNKTNDLLQNPIGIMVQFSNDLGEKQSFQFYFYSKLSRITLQTYQTVINGGNLKMELWFRYRSSIGFTNYPLPVDQEFIGQIDVDGTVLTHELTQSKSLLFKLFPLKHQSRMLRMIMPEAIYKWNINIDQRYLAIIFTYRQCISGEYLENTRCLVCKADEYNYDPKRTSCLPCLGVAQCAKGLIINIDHSFWRPSNTSNEIIQCLNAPSNCKGGLGSGDEGCVPGRIFSIWTGLLGPLCESCDYFNIRGQGPFYKVVPYNCQKCEQTSYIYAVAQSAILLIAVQVVLLLITKNGLLMMIQVWYIGFTNMLPMGVSGLLQISGILIKIFIKHIQVFAILIEVIQLQQQALTSFVGGFLDKLNFVNMSQLSPQCSLSEYSQFQLQFPFVRLAIILIIQLSVVLFLIILQIIIDLIKVHRIKFKQLTFVLLSQYLMSYPQLANESFIVFSCKSVSRKKYLAGYGDYECFTFQHFYYLGIFVLPTICILLILIPLGVLISIIRTKRSHKKYMILSYIVKYGILSEDYRAQQYYYEFLKIYSNIGLAFIINFFVSNINLKVLMIISLLIGYYVITQQQNPYIRRQLLTLDTASILILLLSFILTMVMFQSTNSATKLVIGLSGLVVNIGFLLFLVGKLLKQLFLENRPLILEISDMLRIGSLLRKYPIFSYRQILCMICWKSLRTNYRQLMKSQFHIEQEQKPQEIRDTESFNYEIYY